MTNGSNLLKDGGRSGMVTPLVDVVFNLMITMFIFLMIYMTLVLPRSERPLRFATTELPAAAPYQPYESQIRVVDGSGDYRYYMTTSELRTNQAVLNLDQTTGLLRGIFLGETSPFRTNAETLDLSVLVVDNANTVSVPTNMATLTKVAATNLWLFFHEEWPAKEVERLMEDARRQTASARVGPPRQTFWQKLTGGGSRPGPQVEAAPPSPAQTNLVCHYAIRKNFTLSLLPSKVPFQPAENPLRISRPGDTVKTVATLPVQIPITPLGGIEPYEYHLSNAPPWLKLDARRAMLVGTPPQPGRFVFTVLVKDAQTPRNDWDLAQQLRNAPGHPLVSTTITVEAEPLQPLRATLALPRFGRLGEPFRGAVLVEGGFGRRRFVAQQLPRGLVLNPDSGEITGTPGEKGEMPIVIQVTDELTNSAVARAAAPDWRGIIDPAPAAGIIGLP